MWPALIVLGICILLSTIIWVVWHYYNQKGRFSANSETLKEQKETIDQLEKDIKETKDGLDYANTMLLMAKEDANAQCETRKQYLAENKLAAEQLQSTKEKDELLKSQYKEKEQLLEQHLQDAINNYEEAAKASFSATDEQIAVEKKMLVDELESLRSKVELERLTYLAAQEINRTENIKDSTHFLKLSAEDKEDIQELNKVCKKLSNPTALYKAIYEVFYKTPLSILVGDLGVKGICGIYKITNSNDEKIYIGQSVDVGDRWKQHIKRGCGAEIGTIAGSKLYGAMMDEGIGAFRFELVEQCSRDKLNEREKYWIKYFNSVEFGYNMKE